MLNKQMLSSFATCDALSLVITIIGAKPNLYCEAIELVCGGSPSLCPRRVESPGQSKVGAIAAKTSFNQLFVQHKCTVINEISGNNLQLP